MELKDSTISIYMNGLKIDDMVQVTSIAITESLQHILPFGHIALNDNFDVFNKFIVSGGEDLSIIEKKRGTNDIVSNIYTVLFLEHLNDKVRILHFIYKKPGFFDTKKCRSFKDRSVSQVIRQIITQDYGDTDVRISDANPITTWIQPYFSDGQFINYLINQCFFNGQYNYYAWYNMKNRFTFQSYEEMISSSPEGEYEIADPVIKNQRYFDVRKKFGKRVSYFDITTNKFISYTESSPPDSESTYKIQRLEDKETVSSVVCLPSTNNGRRSDYQTIGLKDNSFITLEYNFSDVLFPCQVGQTFNLKVMSKTLKDASTEFKINAALTGTWVIGGIRKTYSKNGQINTVSFLKKGIESSQTTVKEL